MRALRTPRFTHSSKRLVPVEIVDSTELACYRVRDWWNTICKYSINAAAPALPSSRQPMPGAQHTKQLQTTLRQAHIAQTNTDCAQTALLNQDIQRIASNLNIPRCRPVNITVQYLTTAQRHTISRLINNMIRHTQHSLWEHKAIRTHIRIASSSPLNVCRTFERRSNKQERVTTRPHWYRSSAHLHIWQ